MIEFMPTQGRRSFAAGAYVKSLQEIVDEIVRDLEVKCLGVDDRRIYFQRLNKNADKAVLSRLIADRLSDNPQVRQALEPHVKYIAIS